MNDFSMEATSQMGKREKINRFSERFSDHKTLVIGFGFINGYIGSCMGLESFYVFILIFVFRFGK